MYKFRKRWPPLWQFMEEFQKWIQCKCRQIQNLTLGKNYCIDGQNTQLIFFEKWPLGEGKCPPKLHPRGGFFGPWSFITLKNSHQDLSNERSNFTKEFLEVGHWALKHSHFLTNYLKLQILASYNNLRIGQDSEFAKFWPRALTM